MKASEYFYRLGQSDSAKHTSRRNLHLFGRDWPIWAKANYNYGFFGFTMEAYCEAYKD